MPFSSFPRRQQAMRRRSRSEAEAFVVWSFLKAAARPHLSCRCNMGSYEPVDGCRIAASVLRATQSFLDTPQRQLPAQGCGGAGSAASAVPQLCPHTP